MPIPVVCPSGHHMTLPDAQAGKRYRCPLCFGYIDVPAAAAAPAALPETDAGPAPENAPAARRWARTDRGLGLHYARLVVFLLWILGMCMALLAEPLIDDEVFGWLNVGLILWGYLLTPLLGVVGSILCLWVPSEARARGFVGASLLLDLVMLVLSYLPLWQELSRDDAMLVRIAGIGVEIVSWGCFVLFLRRLAQYLRQEVAEDEAAGILLRGIVLLALVVLLATPYGWVVILRVGWRGRLAVLAFLLWSLRYLLPFVFLVFFINLLFRQLNLIVRLRAVIRQVA